MEFYLLLTTTKLSDFVCSNIVISHAHMRQSARTKRGRCSRCRKKALSCEQHNKQFANDCVVSECHCVVSECPLLAFIRAFNLLVML